MPELQTTYSEAQTEAYAGMVANGEKSNRISRTIEDAAGIGFGLPVERGTEDNECTGTISDATQVLGFTIANQTLGLAPGETADLYQQYDNVAIITEGAIFVTVTGAVADGDALTVGIGAGAGDGIGNTAADATHIALTGWVADQTLAGTGICRIAKR